jgi:hypothetical protein
MERSRKQLIMKEKNTYRNEPEKEAQKEELGCYYCNKEANLKLDLNHHN